MTVVPMHPEMNARRFLEVVIHTRKLSNIHFSQATVDYLFTTIDIYIYRSNPHRHFEYLQVAFRVEGNNGKGEFALSVALEMTHLCADWRHLEIVLDLREGGQLSNLSAVITLDAVRFLLLPPLILLCS